MKIAGIVAEYNPFHKGHAYQIEKIREILGTDTGIVCVMSGDFVQRGEPAMFSKFARAEAAVRCGADLVLELPVHCSVASAERFARGAVQLLGRLGIVDTLVFGSESGDVEAVERAAVATLHPSFDELVREKMKNGCSYPAARSAALGYITGGDIVCSPNDNLGVEYVRAIRQYGYTMKPIVVRRVGSMHDAISDGDMKSGSEIRAIVKSGGAFADFAPESAYEVYVREIAKGRGPIAVENLEQGMLSRLRMLPQEAFAGLPDAAEGLEHKLYRACRRETTLQGIYDAVKSKRYTHVRIRRMTLCAALGITRADYGEDNLYGRVLALNERGGRLLRMTDGVRTVDIISKPAAARALSDAPRRAFELTAAAHDLYVLGCPDAGQRSGESDWKTSPLFIG